MENNKNNQDMKQKNNNLTILNANVQCIHNKINRINLILQNLNPDVVCISEHWASEENIETIHISNYEMRAHFCRKQYIHGGVAILTKQTMLSKPIKVDKYSIEKEVEICGIRLPELHSIVVAVYRSPQGSEELFLENVNKVLEKLTKTYKKYNIFFIGDYNINILQNTNATKELLEVMAQNGLHPAFNEPSRITSISQTCIDNIFVNIPSESYSGQTINLHLADHLGQLISVASIKPEKRKNFVRKRAMKKDNISKFKTYLDTIDWNIIYNPELTAEEAYNVFHECLIKGLDTTCPIEIKKATIQQHHHINSEALQRIKNQLDALHTIIVATKKYHLLEAYKNLKTKYNEEVDKEIRLINSKYIQEAENKMKATWDVIRRETGKNKTKQEIITELTANDFNLYFTTIGKPLLEENGSKNAKEYIHNTITNTIFISSITPEEVWKIIKNLKDKSCKDIYDLSSSLLKQINENICIPLCYLINKCFNEGTFPTLLKKARVIPIYKKGEANQCNNYRPISILPVVSKVFEIVLKTRLVNFLEKYQQMTPNQHGYRTNKSTITALAEVLQDILNAFDKMEYAQVVFCDLSKAFDSVDHKILLQKIQSYGIRGKAHDILASYLQGREQAVQWNDTVSEWRLIDVGVPQGSVVGPILFLLYLNDVVDGVTSGSTCLFADDTTFLNTDKQIEVLRNKTSQTIEEATKWFSSNNLKMNTEKTQILTLFTTKNNNLQSQNIKFLGIQLSETLTWGNHITELRKKLNKSIYRLKVIKNNTTYEATKTTYHSDFHSIASYGILIWGASPEMEAIFILQKKAIRILEGAHWHDTCKPLFKKTKILTLPSVFILTSLMYVHQNQNNFPKNSHYHSYETRRGNDLAIQYHRVKKAQHSTNHLGIKLYNKLPSQIRELNSKDFKKAIKNILTEGAYYSIAEFMEHTIIC